jgi:hypothetical protein
VKRDSDLVALEQHLRRAIRDCVNRTSRKPFRWAGLAGYDQLDAIAQVLHQLPIDTETAYLRSVIPQLDRALEVNRLLAEDVRAAHTTLGQIADCLHYGAASSASQSSSETSHDVRKKMEALLAQFRPTPQQ